MNEARSYLSRVAIHARPAVRPRRRLSLLLALLVHGGIAAAFTATAIESWTPARPTLLVASSVILEHAPRPVRHATVAEPTQQVLEVRDEARESPPLPAEREPTETSAHQDDSPANIREAPITDLGPRAELFARRFAFRFRDAAPDELPEQKPVLAMAGSPPVAPAAPADAGFVRADPVPGRNPAPAYPKSARRRGWEGTVRVRVSIDTAGRPVNVIVLSSSGRKILDNAVRQTILGKWHFAPARRSDRPVPDTWDRSFTFRLGARRDSAE